ncbi:hypothetical protein IP81_11710 [Novosphingobium sp. AAP83]|nr:hypothetical protein IP81_11710 [Novosphingobium sp. AAP83]
MRLQNRAACRLKARPLAAPAPQPAPTPEPPATPQAQEPQHAWLDPFLECHTVWPVGDHFARSVSKLR